MFFGGGTPSLLTPAQLEELLGRLRDTFAIAPDAEVTLETNPGTVTPEKLCRVPRASASTASASASSRSATKNLNFLSRIHDGGQRRWRALPWRARAGFDNLSLDLIYSLPGRRPDAWEETLRRAIALAPDHLSAYSLIVEDNTPLARMVAARQVSPESRRGGGRAVRVDDGACWREPGTSITRSRTTRGPGTGAGTTTPTGRTQNYLAFGPSAHAFWRARTWRTAARWSNVANLSTYIQKLSAGRAPGCLPREQSSERQLMNERIFLGLRSDGLDFAPIRGRFRRGIPARHATLLGRAGRGRGRPLMDAGTSCASRRAGSSSATRSRERMMI